MLQKADNTIYALLIHVYDTKYNNESIQTNNMIKIGKTIPYHVCHSCLLYNNWGIYT